MVFEEWIPDVFKKLHVRKIRFLHLDIDLFEPTHASLEFFFPTQRKAGLLFAMITGSIAAPVQGMLLKNFS